MSEVKVASMEKIEEYKERQRKGVHTEIQYLAESFWLHYGKKESFGMFLGLIKNRGKGWAYKKLSDIKEYERDKKELYPIQWVVKA